MKKNRILLLILGLALVGFYLIWTFVVNLNHEVTSAFEIMNERLIESNAKANGRLDSLYASAYKTSYSKEAHRLNAISKEITNYIDDLKEQLVSNITDPTDYEVMDGSDITDSLFFEDNQRSSKGEEFVKSLESYNSEIIKLFGEDFSAEVNKIQNRFGTNSNLKVKDWLEYNFKGFPLVASLTKLTQIQSDIKSSEKDILQAVLSK